MVELQSNWDVNEFIEKQVEAVRRQVGTGRVLLGLSGGVDSSVCAALIGRAIGQQLICVFVNTGLMRQNEPEEVEAAFGGGEFTFVHINAEAQFLARLDGVTDPEQKRHIIGEAFIRIFEAEAVKIGAVDFLAQGTIYPDVTESGQDGHRAVKSHHNVGGLPERIAFKELVEPLRPLYKEQVRQVGRALGLSAALTERQPFPGPGLGVRCLGAVTKTRLDALRTADFIFRQEIEKAGLAGKLSQYFAALTGLRSVGVRNGARTYEEMAALRAVQTEDFVTARSAPIPHEVLQAAAHRITTEVPGINRVVYDITDKPPGTIEFE